MRKVKTPHDERSIFVNPLQSRYSYDHVHTIIYIHHTSYETFIGEFLGNVPLLLFYCVSSELHA